MLMRSSTRRRMVSSFSYASAPALPPTVTTRKDLKGDTIFIIDGTAMLYKCFFGLGRQKYFKELTTVPQHEDDEPKHCGAVAAMATMFTRFCKNVRPSYVAVVFDASRKTFRNRLYPEYKQQREETPARLGPQFSLAIDVLEVLGARCIQKPDVEADDVMASLSLWATQQNMNVIHISADKDMLQLVKPRVFISDIKAESLVTEATVSEKYGVPPSALAEYFALIGDAADNIPGVKGIGPKIASALINEFSSLECLYETLAFLELPSEYDEAMRRIAKALGHVKCKPEKVAKYLSSYSIEEVQLFRSLIQLRENICIMDAINQKADPPISVMKRSIFKYRGATDSASEVLKNLTACGTLQSCLKNLEHLKK